MLEKKKAETGRTVYLLSDEPYKKITYDGAVVPSVIANYKNTIILTSYSKDLSLPGERIGWLAVHPEADDFENLMNGIIMCNRILGYVNAPAIMQKVVAELQGVSVDIDFYKKRETDSVKFLQKQDLNLLSRKALSIFFRKHPEEMI